MFPSILYKQIQTGIHDFLTTTFTVSTPFFKGIIDRLFAEEDVLKGPYISMKLPFKNSNLSTDYFTHLKMEYKPYLHQELAFQRLSGSNLKSTIISTGTGSGKTECFLYPILDHCCRKALEGQKGIKAIIVYPMNALATDQAKRFAHTIWNNPDLRSNVRVGLYVGSRDEIPTQAMMHDKVITDKKTMQLDPPDILMTNYKMLDYLLIRPDDYPIWQFNSIETFKYLIVDELHTFDGAQGTDLACLIRRLKVRLQTPENSLCCIGTSATLGGNEDSTELVNYTSKIFGESFDADAIIRESVLSYEDFFKGITPKYFNVPGIEEAQILDADNFGTVQNYIKAQYSIWFDKDINYEDIPKALPVNLKQLDFFRKLILVLGNRVFSVQEISRHLDNIIPDMLAVDSTLKVQLLQSILALVSIAKLENGRPFLSLRVQYWLRELRRIVAEVKQKPNLHFSDDLTADGLFQHLPVIHCRECGAMGWAGTSKSGNSIINSDLKLFYNSFFHNANNVKYIFPLEEDFKRTTNQQARQICGNCLNIVDDLNVTTCPECGVKDKMLKVMLPDNQKKIGDSKIITTHDCPYCDGRDSLTIIGSRASSLISVIISQLFASKYNDDKKLITFSDSVQDASHRAGFFSARTYRFNFRSALQQFIDSHQDVKVLPEVIERFIDYYWNKLGAIKFVSNFIPNNMFWLDDFEYFKNNGRAPEGSYLISNIKKRIEWEIISEYGFNCRIGRTLEKTSSSTVTIDQELLRQVADHLLEPLRNIGNLRDLELPLIVEFLQGLLYRLKSGGGIYSADFLSYIKTYGTTYLINRIDYLPNFSEKARAPRFVTTNNRGRFDRLYGSGKATWYEQWVIKVFGELDHLLESYSRDVLREVMSVLVKAKVLREDISHGYLIWSINQDSLVVGREVKQLRCDKCGNQISVSASESKLWNNSTCIRYNCHGHYQSEEDTENYYHKLYKNADIQRIYTEEHTGLLDRKVREKIENTFINQDAPWNPNLLSCTPTLEMGIDIGDLSSLILCSIPPSVSSYLQRIGRSGRRDGNSLDIAVANARPHDLYFYENPLEMISGTVQTPGCLIDAPAILERQFTAFCFDRWVETGVTSLQLPAKLAAILAQLNKKSVNTFPYNFTHYIQIGKEELFNNFIMIFRNDLSDDAVESLRKYINNRNETGKGLIYRIHDSFWEIYNEVESLKKRIKKISVEIKKRKDKMAKDRNYEQDLAELQNEKVSLNSIIKHIRDKNVYNFFTDEGLLPNYAFPQAGIILRSVILKKKQRPDTKGKYKSQIFEYHRPSSMAIKELAPENKFYAEGRKVVIDQIDMNQSEIENWIFCAKCSYMAKAALDHNDKCPKCGSPLWSDSGQKREMIKMKQVIATTLDYKSRSWDESDDREPEFYNKKIIAEVEMDNISHAFQLEDQPFGFEFIKKADFREVNFGNLNSLGQMMTINGSEIPVNGFKICGACGKVYNKKEEIRHDITCKYRNKDVDTDIINSTFLYREFRSEAIRMLLPITSESISDKKMHSLIAGLYLGLKLKFKGNIDHLHTTIQEIPFDSESDIKKNYLLLYDTVPGGTGYLKQLMKSSEDLVEVFELALNYLKACDCHKTEGKDGCYKCIYAYRYNYQKPNISRDTAIALFESIVQNKDNYVKINTIDEISTNSILESELEALFIYTLNQYTKQNVNMRPEMVNGKPGWFISINNIGYFIEPQVELGIEQGVVIPSRADFVFFPEKETSNGKPIAIFTDGYMFHGDPKNAKGQLGKDLAKRMAILRSGNFQVWSLSWNDIKHHDKINNKPTDCINPDVKNLSKLMEKINNSSEFVSYKYHYKKNSFDLFLIFLGKPDIACWRQYSTALLVTQLLSNDSVTSQEIIEEFQDSLLNRIEEEDVDFASEGHIRYNLKTLHYPDGKNKVKSFTYLSSPATTLQDLMDIKLICRIYDEDISLQKEWRNVWNDILHYINVFQFIPNAYFVSTLGIANGNYSTLEEVGDTNKKYENHTNDEIKAILELIDEKYHSIINSIIIAEIELPEIGFELMEDSVIIGQAEMAWQDYRVALLHKVDYQFEEIFVKKKWKTFRLDDFLSDINSNIKIIKAIMNKQEI